MALYEAARAVYPDALVEDANALAGQLCERVNKAAAYKGQRSNFGTLSGLEAAHKLAQFVCKLPRSDRLVVEKWLRGGA
mgnify:FL=1